MNRKRRIVFLGGGQMGEALIGGIIGRSIARADELAVIEPDGQRRELLIQRYGVKAGADTAWASEASLLVLAVKPQILDAAAAPLKPLLPRDACVLSIVAGAPIARITSLLGNGRVIRSMPNAPARAGKGMTVWTASPEVDDESKAGVKAILSALGTELETQDESMIDKATAISGSGPAYVFLFVEALAEAAVHLGFGRKEALLLASSTVAGSAEYLISSGLHPAQLRDSVVSPGGTTAQALYYLEKGGLRSTLSRAVWAAYERALELGRGEPGRAPKD
jgi:pyrroline-5-carboxylate reductase